MNVSPQQLPTQSGTYSSQIRRPFDRAGFRFIFRKATAYGPARVLYDYLALRVNGAR